MKHSITRRQALGAMACGAVSAAGMGICGTALAGTATQRLSGARPNIIFILADDLGYGDLGCYGQETIQTPVLDRLASEGVRFTQCYSGSTVCAPSRCCLMTGMHTGHCTIRGNADIPLRSEDVTVADVLKDAGYSTALIGKWGLGEPDTTGIPNKQGFDYFFGYLNQVHAHNYYPEYLWRNEERVPLEGNKERPDKPRVSSERAQYSSDLFTKEACAFITQQKQNPFFLYLAYTLPHANNERGAAEGDGMEAPSHEPYADRPWPSPQKGHAAMITRLDRQVGEVLDAVKAQGIENNTIIFFASDNGPHKEGGADPKFFKSSGPLRGLKRDLYEGGIRVPVLARWPGQIRPGSVSDQIWAFWDFLPTAADLAGADVPATDGVSAVPALAGKKLDNERPLYWEFHERAFQRAARMGKWKAVWRASDKPLELYNLESDLGETKDVADANPKITKRMRRFLETSRTTSERWPGN